jgi:hypothetical protein
MLHATWLLLAIAAAQNFKPSDFVRYVAPLNFVVQNFESVWGTFPLALLHQFLSTLVLTTLEESGPPAMIAVVQDCWYQYGAWLDADMFAASGKDRITIRPAHAKFTDVPQCLLDPNLRDLLPLSYQVLDWAWCGHCHVRALHGELCWFLSVCPSVSLWGYS